MIRTAESVTQSHPDKVCDQISDAILDACLKDDPTSRVAVETMGGHGIISITGELTTKTYVNMRAIAQQVYKDCGYGENIGVNVNVVEQSPEIAAGVNQDGAGDQGIMVGYATAETPEMLPLEVMLSRHLARAMGPRDGKSQVTVQDGKVLSFITSVCAPDAASEAALEKAVNDHIVPILAPGVDLKKAWLRNPNGKWDIGGFAADTGLTGRKLAVDNYGPSIPLGGGCFSGKDATKVDRSAAYMARRIAVDYLKKKGAKEVYVHVAYAIGVADPLMAVVTVDGVQENISGYDLRPKAIIDFLDLRKPQFRVTSQYGHFGNGFTWDR
ncbi:methionine adenosyltransferase domain-containing protein [Patescibacteria group bacterium]|nr:methionine adenosyltransferase domain-containing protein [Patescibacteria group bacterium]